MASSFIQSLDGELICGICLEFFDMPVMLPCSHNFCKKCIIGLVDNQVSFSFISIGPISSFNCPVCQLPFSIKRGGIEALPVNLALDSIISLYKSSSPVDIFDGAWNTDQDVAPQDCTRHGKKADQFCETCNMTMCTSCQAEHQTQGTVGQQHRVIPLREAMVMMQTEIASILTEIKKKSIPLNDKIKVLQETVTGIEKNDELVEKQLEHHCSAIMSTIRQRQEELRRVVQNDITKLKRPVEDQLKKCMNIKTAIQELMKKLSAIRRNKDNSLKLKLMKDAKKQLNALLCFDIYWSYQEHSMPEVAMPTWELETGAVHAAVGDLHWDCIEVRPKLCTTSTQTDPPVPDQDTPTGNTLAPCSTVDLPSFPVEQDQPLQLSREPGPLSTQASFLNVSRESPLLDSGCSTVPFNTDLQSLRPRTVSLPSVPVEVESQNMPPVDNTHSSLPGDCVQNQPASLERGPGGLLTPLNKRMSDLSERVPSHTGDRLSELPSWENPSHAGGRMSEPSGQQFPFPTTGRPSPPSVPPRTGDRMPEPVAQTRVMPADSSTAVLTGERDLSFPSQTRTLLSVSSSSGSEVSSPLPRDFCLPYSTDNRAPVSTGGRYSLPGDSLRTQAVERMSSDTSRSMAPAMGRPNQTPLVPSGVRMSGYVIHGPVAMEPVPAPPMQWGAPAQNHQQNAPHNEGQSNPTGVTGIVNGMGQVRLEEQTTSRVEGRNSYPPDPIRGQQERRLVAESVNRDIHVGSPSPEQPHTASMATAATDTPGEGGDGRTDEEITKEALNQFIARRRNTATPSASKLSSSGSVTDSSSQVVTDSDTELPSVSAGKGYHKQPVSVNIDLSLGGSSSQSGRKMLKAKRISKK